METLESDLSRKETVSPIFYPPCPCFGLCKIFRYFPLVISLAKNGNSHQIITSGYMNVSTVQGMIYIT